MVAHRVGDGGGIQRGHADSSDGCSIATAHHCRKQRCRQPPGAGRLATVRSTQSRCRSDSSSFAGLGRFGSEGPAPISSTFVARLFQIERMWRKCI